MKNQSIIRIEIQSSPRGFDVAFAPSDEWGSLGNLNRFVLNELGFPMAKEVLPDSKGLKQGSAEIVISESNCIVILIVTVSLKNSDILLKNNFSKALEKYSKSLENKRIWIPLMGVGAGNLDPRESFSIIYTTLTKFINKGFIPGEIVISVPEITDNETVEWMNKTIASEVSSSFVDQEQSSEKNEKESSVNKDSESPKYWWINANDDFWNIDDFNIGDEQKYSTHNKNKNKRNVFQHFFKVNPGDKAIGYQVGTNGKTKAIFEITKKAEILEGDTIKFKIIEKIPEQKQISFAELKDLEFFNQSEVVTRNNQGSIFQLTVNEYNDIYKLVGPVNTPKIIKTGLDNDGAYTTEDLLNIENDVRSFALILASKDIKPPIAVALFGKWGSGKSFFMEQLSKRVSELSINQGFLEEGETSTEQEKEIKKDAFCKGIVQIKFNAWSYIDSNLWAGLVSTIFEKLNEYITESTKSGVAKLKVQGKLGERLKAFHALKVTEEGKKNHLEILKQGYKQEAEKLETNIIQNIGQVILEVSETNATLKKAYNGLFLDSEKFGENFTISGTNLVSEYKYWANFIQNIKKVPQLLKYGLWAIIGIFLTIALLYLIEWDYKGIFYSLPFVTVLTKAGIWWKTKKSKIKKYVNQFNDLIEKNSDQKDKVTKLEKDIRFVDDQMKQAQEKIKDLENEIQKIQYDLINDITGAAIRDFINERAELKDYKNHLGIVSIIRKDFETLSELFLESNVSDEDVQSNDSIEKTKKEVLVEDRGFIKDQFLEGKKLERIILYIDDLDRCSDEKVLEVIQAVHLLMAFPLFNVVVGVDKRCVNNALIYKNLLQYSKFTTLENIEKVGIHVISPSEYLEKIFQIPFQLDDPSNDDIKGMVDVFLKNQVEKEVTVKKETPVSEEISDDTLQESTGEKETLGTSKSKAVLKLVAENITSGIPEIGKPELTVSKKKTITITPNDLKLTKEEIELLREIIWLVGSIPRTVKRYLNIYRIIRAHQDLNIDPKVMQKEFLTIMFLLAINIGEHKEHAPKLIKNIQSNKNKRLENYLVGHKDLTAIKNKIKNSQPIKELLQYDGIQFEKHIPFVGRFSFANIEYSNNIVEKELNAK